MYYTTWRYPNGTLGCAYFKSGYTSLFIKDKNTKEYIEVPCVYKYIKPLIKKRKRKI